MVYSLARPVFVPYALRTSPPVPAGFTAHFFSALGIEGQTTLPCVVFFRVHEVAIEDVEIAKRESAGLIHGFPELYGAIQQYLSAKTTAPVEASRAIRSLKGGAKFLPV